MAESVDKQKLETLLDVLNKPLIATPNLNRVLQRMIDPPYKGKVLFSHISQMSPDDFTQHDHIKVIKWFRSHPDEFAIFEGDNGRIAMVAVRLKNARLCWKSNKGPGACTNNECTQFHVCQKYIGGDCTGSQCPFDHHFQSNHSRKLLKHLQLEKYKDHDLLTIFQLSQLQVCNFYNREGSCNNEDRCIKLHVCAEFICGTCFEHCPKQLKHEFDTPHSQRLLRSYYLHDQPLQDVLSQLLIVNYHAQKKHGLPRNNEVNLKDLAEALFNLTGKKNEDVKAEDQDVLQLKPIQSFQKENASSMKPLEEKKLNKYGAIKAPYQWKIEIFGTWVALDQTRNRKLEETYCDPAEEATAITLPDVEECSLSETIITVNFNTMTASLQNGKDELKLQRVVNSTDSWLWYFQTDAGTWQPYSEDDQELLDSGYMFNQKRVFVGKKGNYRIKLSDLTQRNRETGKERQVRRRPLFEKT